MFWLIAVGVLSFIGAVLTLRSDVRQRRLYNHWREGRLPRARSKSAKARQLSIRGMLLLMTVVAVLVCYLQSESAWSGFFAGLGCVLTGILIGLDYSPQGMPVMRGPVLSATLGGLSGVLAFAIFMTIVQVCIVKTMPSIWFMQSLGRLVLLWSCVAFFGGVTIGLWVVNAPFRTLPKLHPLTRTRLKFSLVDPATAEHESQSSSSQPHSLQPNIYPSEREQPKGPWWLRYLPAVLASILVHLTFVSLQAGLFDVGARISSQQGKPTARELEIIVSLEDPAEDDAEADLSSVQIEESGEVAVDETDESQSAPEQTEDFLDEEEISNTANILDPDANPSDELVEGGQGTLGTATNESFEIPLSGQAVRIRTRIGTWSMHDVSELRLLADGNRIRVDADTTGMFTGIELPLKTMSVEFESPDTASGSLLATKPFVNVASELTNRNPGKGEAKIEILDVNSPSLGTYNASWGRPALPAASRFVSGKLKTKDVEQTLNSKPPNENAGLENSEVGDSVVETNGGIAATIQSEPVDKGVILDGRCPVHLIEQGRWKKGDDNCQEIHDGWIVKFADQAAQEKFRANPSDYMPVLNGLDVVAATESRAVLGDRRWGVLYDDDGTGPNKSRMYLFANTKNRNDFEAAPDRYLATLRTIDLAELKKPLQTSSPLARKANAGAGNSRVALGLVEHVRSQIVVISLGEDDGIRPGSLVDVYRGDKFLAQIEIVDTRADRASGFVAAGGDQPMQRGDQVRVSKQPGLQR